MGDIRPEELGFTPEEAGALGCCGGRGGLLQVAGEAAPCSTLSGWHRDCLCGGAREGGNLGGEGGKGCFNLALQGLLHGGLARACGDTWESMV